MFNSSYRYIYIINIEINMCLNSLPPLPKVFAVFRFDHATFLAEAERGMLRHFESQEPGLATGRHQDQPQFVPWKEKAREGSLGDIQPLPAEADKQQCSRLRRRDPGGAQAAAGRQRCSKQRCLCFVARTLSISLDWSLKLKKTIGTVGDTFLYGFS